MEAHRVGLPMAVGIAVVAAGAATFALRPRSELIDPAPVAATDYFSASQLDRIHDYRDPQRLLGIGGLVVSGGTLALIRRFPRSWWAVGAVAVVVLSAVFVSYGPVILDPLFNKFTALPESPLRSAVLALARKDGVDVGQVYRVDASRRTTGANAYVNGLGHTKRVVLYDNLMNDFSPDQVESVVAHELGHVKHRDVPRGILWLAIAAPAGMLVVQRLTERLALGAGGGPRAER